MVKNAIKKEIMSKNDGNLIKIAILRTFLINGTQILLELCYVHLDDILLEIT